MGQIFKLTANVLHQDKQLREQAEKEMRKAKLKAAQEAANKQLTDDVVAHALGRDPLTHQSVVDKLDALPVFHIKAANGNMVPTDDAGTPCGCFYLDADDAKRQMARLEETNAVLGLELEVTPLGTAFALSEGWSQVPEGTQLRLQGSLALLASLPEPPEPLPQVLQQRFNQLTSALPLHALPTLRPSTERVCREPPAGMCAPVAGGRHLLSVTQKLSFESAAVECTHISSDIVID